MGEIGATSFDKRPDLDLALAWTWGHCAPCAQNQQTQMEA